MPVNSTMIIRDSYNVKELEAYAKKHSPEAFAVLPNHDIHHWETRKFTTSDGNTFEEDLLYVGWFAFANNLNANKVFARPNPNGFHIQFWRQKKVNGPLELVNKAVWTSIRMINPISSIQLAKEPGQNDKKKLARLEVRIRKIVYIHYIFMICGKLDHITNDQGYDIEQLFEEACGDILRVATHGPLLKQKKRKASEENSEEHSNPAQTATQRPVKRARKTKASGSSSGSSSSRSSAGSAFSDMLARHQQETENAFMAMHNELEHEKAEHATLKVRSSELHHQFMVNELRHEDLQKRFNEADIEHMDYETKYEELKQQFEEYEDERDMLAEYKHQVFLVKKDLEAAQKQIIEEKKRAADAEAETTKVKQEFAEYKEKTFSLIAEFGEKEN